MKASQFSDAQKAFIRKQGDEGGRLLSPAIEYPTLVRYRCVLGGSR